MEPPRGTDCIDRRLGGVLFEMTGDAPLPFLREQLAQSRLFGPGSRERRQPDAIEDAANRHRHRHRCRAAPPRLGSARLGSKARAPLEGAWKSGFAMISMEFSLVEGVARRRSRPEET